MDFYGHFMQLCLLCWTWYTSASANSPEHRGRYTRDAYEWEMLVPRKVDADGAFQSFELPHFYDLEEARARRRALPGEESVRVRYAVPLGGREHVVELWPSHGFLAPALVVERRRRDLWGDARLSHVRREQCHYVGRVHGDPASRAVLSACYDGLAGYVRVGDVRYFVEPAAESRPDAAGRHLHVAFRADAAAVARARRDPRGGRSFCGVEDEWQAAWQDRFAWELQMNPEFPSMLSSPKSSALVPRFIELLVVVDKKFIDFHKDHDSENYVLTLLNMVSDYYHDATVGRLLEIVVVRIMYLEKEEEELDLTVSPNADKTLDSFMTWAQRINPVDPKHPNHHDIAVLITRYDICAENASNCNLLGLASVAAACQPHRSACICEDSGLEAAVTIAHELGHVMGCSHDKAAGDGEVCESTTPDGTGFVMSPYLSPRTSVWSNCSRRFIGTLLDSGMGECLLDEPAVRPYKSPQMPPGAMYDANYQCKDMLGAAEACPTKRDEICKVLWCKTSPSQCAAPGKPAADGTKCGESKWCYGGECVPVGQRPAAVDGGWGAWGAWSTCSRSCGAGVEATERTCDNPTPQNRGRFCLGERKRYRVCNVEPCDPNKPTFREVQCSEFDDKPFDGRTYKWKPYMHGKSGDCELVCSNDVPFYASLAPVVRDGTRCRKGTRDMCVGGQCMHVGCDWVLDSETLEDVCGECGGDGSHCHLVETLYDTPNGRRYVKIGTVPTNSFNVKIQEVEPTVNTIAVGSKNGEKFFLNGNYSEYANGEYSFGTGVLGVYAHPEPEREVLAIKGPTTEELTIYIVFYGHPNPGVRISYFEHLNNGSSTYSPSYEWEFLEWGPCSTRCGGGSQVSEANCVEKKAGKVSGTFCDANAKPKPQTRVCNMQKCLARWHTGSWSACSGCLDHPGEQQRAVECTSESPTPEGQPVLVEASECKGRKPEDKQDCHSEEPCKGDQFGEGNHLGAFEVTKVLETRHSIESLERSTLGRTTIFDQTSFIPALSGTSNYIPKFHSKTQSIKKVTNSVSHSLKNLTQTFKTDDESKKDKRQPSVVALSTHHQDTTCTNTLSGIATFITSDSVPLLTFSVSDMTSTSDSYTKTSPEVAIDRVPESELILEEAPLMGTSYSRTLSEITDQEMDENIGDPLDTSRKKLFNGKETLERTKEIKKDVEKEKQHPV